MKNENLVLKLLARALLDIRIASHEGNMKKAFELADVFHNVPYQIEQIQGGEGRYNEVVDWIEMRCKQKGMQSWLQVAMDDVARIPPT